MINLSKKVLPSARLFYKGSPIKKTIFSHFTTKKSVLSWQG